MLAISSVEPALIYQKAPQSTSLQHPLLLWTPPISRLPHPINPTPRWHRHIILTPSSTRLSRHRWLAGKIIRAMKWLVLNDIIWLSAHHNPKKRHREVFHRGSTGLHHPRLPTIHRRSKNSNQNSSSRWSHLCVSYHPQLIYLVYRILVQSIDYFRFCFSVSLSLSLYLSFLCLLSFMW